MTPEPSTDAGVTRDWLGFIDGTSRGDIVLKNLDYNGQYSVETDDDGELFLTVYGTLSWKGPKRDKDKAFGLFFAINR